MSACGDRSSYCELGTGRQIAKSPTPPKKLSNLRVRGASFDGDGTNAILRWRLEMDHAVETCKREQRAPCALGDRREGVAAADDPDRSLTVPHSLL
mmetsp:Transcript_34153/g.68970  ORF Transcript_34153/g.68970 Transcript_34153/m.68970 type:complete len:96 (-) Transcript_34153:182-469(-)